MAVDQVHRGEVFRSAKLMESLRVDPPPPLPP